MYIVCLQALMNVGYAHTTDISSPTGPGLYLAEWLCPLPLPLQTFPSRYACSPIALKLSQNIAKSMA